MNKKLVITLASAALVTAFSQAQIVTVNLGGHTGSNGNSLFLVNYNGSTKTINNGTGLNATVESMSFIAYCVELDQGAALNSSYPAYRESIRTYLPAPTGNRMAYIYNNHHNGGLTLDQQIAVQVALWEARYDTNFNLDSGNFSVITLNSSIKAAAQAILNNVMSPTGPIGEAMYYQSNTNQDIMGPVPEPASLIALGVGAAALLRRRKLNKSK